MVALDLERDGLLVTYDPTVQAPASLIGAIAGLGYVARVATDLPGTSIARERPSSAPRGHPPVDAALERARREGKPLLIEFHAAWCAPCRQLETTFAEPAVRALLEKMIVLRIDTDRQAEIAAAFGVLALPDLRLLHPDGTEARRFLGYVAPRDLCVALESVLEQQVLRRL